MPTMPDQPFFSGGQEGLQGGSPLGLDEALAGAMAQHDVDGITPQFFQGGLDVFFGQGPVSLGMGLGRQSNGTPPALEPPGNVLVGAIEGGGIDKGDAAFHRGADYPGAFLHG